MKKIIVCILFFPLSVACFAQAKNNEKLLTREAYLTKSKNQKSGARVLLIGGAALTTIGATLLASNILVENPNSQPVKNRDKAGVILVITGGSAMTSSIILFRASKRNNKKAYTIQLQQQSTWVQNNRLLQKSSFIALSFKFFIK
jgi:hypothetical protein